MHTKLVQIFEGCTYTVYVLIFKGSNFHGRSISSGFILEGRLLSILVLHMRCDYFKDLIFVYDKLPAKIAKIASLKFMYAYSISRLPLIQHFTISFSRITGLIL